MTSPLRRVDSSVVVANATLFLMTMFWGSFFPLIDVLLRTWDVLSVTAARQVIGALAVWAILVFGERGQGIRGPLPIGRLLVLGICGIALSSLLISLGISYAGAVSSAIISTMTPIAAALLARFLYQIPLGRGIVAGTALAVGGGVFVVLATGGDIADFRGGEILVLASNTVWTWYSLAAQHWLRGWSQLRITALTMTPGAIVLVAAVVLAHASGIFEIRIDLSPPSLAIILYGGIFTIGLGNFMWNFGVNRVGVTVASMYGNLVPISAVLIAMLFGSYPNALHLAGGAMILCGVVYAQLRSRRRQT